MEQRNRRPSGIGLGGILIRVALVLAVLALLCVHLMGGLFAKYTTSGKGGDDARVAKFQVNVTGDAKDMTITAAENPATGTYEITIRNDSEVAVRYDLLVSYQNSVPGVDYSFDQTSGYLAVGADAVTRTLTFHVSDWAAFTQGKTGASASETLDFTVTVNVVQVD